jgi:hypothetical protein
MGVLGTIVGFGAGYITGAKVRKDPVRRVQDVVMPRVESMPDH